METGEKAIVYVCNGDTPVVPDIIRTSDESVVSLSMEDGGVCVIAAGAGSATLTLGFSGYSAEVTVTVEQGVELESLALANLEGGYSVKVGENLYTTVYFRPQGAPEHPIVWEIDNPSVATISGSGNSCKITGVSPGTTTFKAITAEPVNGKYYSVFGTITVYDETSGPIPMGINLSAYYVELMPTGGSTASVVCTAPHRASGCHLAQRGSFRCHGGPKRPDNSRRRRLCEYLC